MRKVIGGLILALYCAALLHSNAADPSFTWRFAGAKSLSESDKLLTWKSISQLPEYTGFETNLIQRGAETLAKELAKKNSADAKALATHLQPIVTDLWFNPSLYELRRADSAHTWILAAKIPQPNHDKWSASWAAIAKANAAGNAKISREGDWTILGNATADETKALLEKAKAPFTDALHVNGDAQMLSRFFGEANPTRAELRVTPRGDGFRSEGRIQFANDLPLKAEKWTVPTNTIREPVLGFTAIQGAAKRLSRAKIFAEGKAPNQIFIWSEQVNPFTTMFAFTVGDPKNFVLSLAPVIQEKAKLAVGHFEMNTNSGALYLKGLPIAIPYLRPAHTHDAGFVMGGLFPLEQFAPEPIPAELASQVTARNDLLYYDWELTGLRLVHWRPLLQIAGFVRGANVPNFEAPPQVWLSKAAEKLGNSVTEIALKNPRELAFVRSSTLGFSALELLTLTRWISGPESEISLKGESAPATSK